MNTVLACYAHVVQTALLTDDGPEQLTFYKSLDFGNTRDLGLNAIYRTSMQREAPEITDK